MTEFVDRALLVFKGKKYLPHVHDLNLVNKPKYEKVLKLIHYFKSTQNEGYLRDIEEFSLLAAVFTETFYHMNTLAKDVLLDVKFYSENLLNILLFLYDDGVNEITSFIECSNGLKTIDVEGIYKDVLDIKEKNEVELVMLKGKLMYALVVTIMENNNSSEYHDLKEKET
jgi:hypothetical protein